MTRFSLLAIALIAALGWAADDAAAQRQKIKPTVDFAKTWDSAIEEAKLLNVPIVVHDHGFY